MHQRKPGEFLMSIYDDLNIVTTTVTFKPNKVKAIISFDKWMGSNSFCQVSAKRGTFRPEIAREEFSDAVSQSGCCCPSASIYKGSFPFEHERFIYLCEYAMRLQLLRQLEQLLNLNHKIRKCVTKNMKGRACRLFVRLHSCDPRTRKLVALLLWLRFVRSKIFLPELRIVNAKRLEESTQPSY